MTRPDPPPGSPPSPTYDALTAQLCQQIGAEYLGGVTPNSDWHTRMRSYHVLGDRARAARGKIDYLHIRKSGNFGNNIIQMLNALIVAEQHGIPVVAHKTDWFGDVINKGATKLLHRNTALEQQKTGLSGTYFLKTAIEGLKSQPADRFLRMVETCLKPGFSLKPDRQAGICLNLRGGYDVFENPKPNANYGQPPLSYYQFALRQLIQQHGEMEIEIVHQDERNPVLPHLRDWLQAEGLAFHQISAGPEGDAKAILSARHVVVGWTSFSAALALLSDHIESLTVFRAAHLQEVLRRAVPNMYVVMDTEQKYFKPNKWRGTNRQRQMMIDYPAQNLGLSDIAVPSDSANEARQGNAIRRKSRINRTLASLKLRPF